MAIESAPAIEWDADFTALTVYFVSGGGIVQTSASRPGDLGATPFFNTAATAGTVIASGASPRVVYGGGIEGSHRTLGIRGYTSDLSRADQLKSILIAHTFAGEDPFEN
jgi:hypothetical protein